MSFNVGMSWLAHRRKYQIKFGESVPDWVCVFDLLPRLRLVRVALDTGWRLPQKVLIADEFHAGRWSVWSTDAQ